MILAAIRILVSATAFVGALEANVGDRKAGLGPAARLAAANARLPPDA